MTDQVSDQVSDQVNALLRCLRKEEAVTAAELMARLNLRHKPTFQKNHLNPALAAGFLEMSQPDSPRSPTQRYRLTAPGKELKTQLP